jgi:hypothetical protein
MRLIILSLLILAISASIPTDEEVFKTEMFGYRHKLILTYSGEVWLSTYEYWYPQHEEIKCKFELPRIINILSDYNNNRYDVFLLTEDTQLIGIDGRDSGMLEHFGRSRIHEYSSYLGYQHLGSECELIPLRDRVGWLEVNSQFNGNNTKKIIIKVEGLEST